jgi:hypothetical protein
MSFQATIEEAAAVLEKLMLEARANEQSKPNIDVDIKILDSCCQLFAAIQVHMNYITAIQAGIFDPTLRFV